LATHLAINPNTIQRAFRELEAEGYLYASPGKGWFVSYQQDMGDLKSLRRNTLLRVFDETVRELFHLGVEKEELSQRLSGEG
jgi:GntR family transcriptional regulator